MVISIEQNDGFLSITATGGQTDLDFDFPLYEKSHLQILRTRSGTTTTLVLNTDYTIADGELEQEAGGTAVLVTGATAGDIYTLLLNVPEARTTDFNQAGDFLAETLNRELDLQTQITQQLRRDVDKSATLPDTSTLTSLELPTPQASKLIGWNSSANGMTNYTAADFGAIALTPFAETLLDDTTASEMRTTLGGVALLASPAFTGNPTAPTPSAGDNDTSIATTAFVRGEGPLHKSVSTLSGSTTLTTSDYGKFIQFNAASLTFTLPATSAADVGRSFTFWNYGPATSDTNGTLARAGSDVIFWGADQYSATSLIIRPGEIVNLMCYSAGVWVATSPTVRGKNSIVSSATYATNTTLTTTIPLDDTIPQNTEGTEILSLAYTPTNASSKLIIRVEAWASIQTSGQALIAALFVDSTANALKAAARTNLSNSTMEHVNFEHEVSATSTSSRTYKVRLGASSGDCYPNGASGSRYFGGVLNCRLTVIEVTP